VNPFDYKKQKRISADALEQQIKFNQEEANLMIGSIIQAKTVVDNDADVLLTSTYSTTNTNQVTCHKFGRHRPPHIFWINGSGQGRIAQGCCNDWMCPRCGEIRAREEYKKIMFGAMTLVEEGHDLYFLTLTCRGSELSLVEAEKMYYKNTSSLLNCLRMQCGRAGGYWAYVQVTERQKRGHPHSHLIITYAPRDVVETKRGKRMILKSDWLRDRCISAGLGDQYEITKIRDAGAVARYIAKYLFKDAIKTKWPKGWKRIRYSCKPKNKSRRWPIEEKHECADAWALVFEEDWQEMEALGIVVTTKSAVVMEDAEYFDVTCVEYR